MKKDAKVYVAGHRGPVGSAIVKNLIEKGYSNLITRTRVELDLTDTQTASVLFANEKPKYVFLAGAKVGGIVANNKYRADFIYKNLMIQNNVIHRPNLYGTKKLLFFGKYLYLSEELPAAYENTI